MSKVASSVDAAVGARVRARRRQLGLSQGKLGKELGITFQQIQKYEKGVNRVGASRLQAMASVLGVPVSYFFPDPDPASNGIDDPTSLLGSRQAVDLLTAFTGIKDPAVKKAVLDLTLALKRAAGKSTRRHN